MSNNESIIVLSGTLKAWIPRMGSIFPCCLLFGNAGGLQILRCRGFEVKYYVFTLDALTLKPSDVCNVGVKLEKFRTQKGFRSTFLNPLLLSARRRYRTGTALGTAKNMWKSNVLSFIRRAPERDRIFRHEASYYPSRGSSHSKLLSALNIFLTLW
jgi:hypothetical protein